MTNPYLKLGGRLVCVAVLAVGIIAALIGIWFVVESVPLWSGESWWGTRGPVRMVEAAMICGVFAALCFRYCARLKREERSGIQI